MNLGQLCNSREEEIRLRVRESFTTISDSTISDILNDLSDFEMGRNLLINRDFDAKWTDVVLTSKKSEFVNQLEKYILTCSPFILSWRELLTNFKSVIQSLLKEDCSIASIPCGAMREILELDFSEMLNFELVGVDIDDSSLNLAKQVADSKGLSSHLILRNADAWNLPFQSQFDVLSTCGLNIYVQDRLEKLKLYRELYRVLKPGGILLISFLIPPPKSSNDIFTNFSDRSKDNMFFDFLIFDRILNCKFCNYDQLTQIQNDLASIGFSSFKLYPGHFGVFPLLCAVKQ